MRAATAAATLAVHGEALATLDRRHPRNHFPARPSPLPRLDTRRDRLPELLHRRENVSPTSPASRSLRLDHFSTADELRRVGLATGWIYSAHSAHRFADCSACGAASDDGQAL